MWNQKNRFCEKSSGFTLLEVIIAISILSVAVLAISNMHSLAVVSTGRAERMSLGTLLARQKMGELILELEKRIAKGEFPDNEKKSGEFEGEWAEEFRWEMELSKVELPVVGGESGGMVGGVAQLISKQLSNSVRQVKLKVVSEVLGEEQAIEIVTHIVKGLKVTAEESDTTSEAN